MVEIKFYFSKSLKSVTFLSSVISDKKIKWCGTFDHTVTVNKVNIESGAESMTSWLELDIEILEDIGKSCKGFRKISRPFQSEKFGERGLAGHSFSAFLIYQIFIQIQVFMNNGTI